MSTACLLLAAAIAAEPEPAPASGPPPATVAAAPVRQRITAAPAAPAAQGAPWSLQLGLEGGYDSNVLIESSNAPEKTDSSGSAWSADLKGAWRFLDTETRKAGVQLLAGYAWYPEQDAADLARVGAAVNASTSLRCSLGRIDPGIVAAAHRLWLDGRPVATVAGATLFASRLDGAQVDIASLAAQRIVYDRDGDASGVQVDASWKRWWMPGTAPTTRRRIEAGLRATSMSAQAGHETYLAAAPQIAAVWRFGDRQEPGAVDAQVRLGSEWRWYRDGVGQGAERSRNDSMRISAIAWLSPTIGLGPYVALSRRDSSISTNDYERVQAGIRLDAQW